MKLEVWDFVAKVVCTPVDQITTLCKAVFLFLYRTDAPVSNGEYQAFHSTFGAKHKPGQSKDKWLQRIGAGLRAHPEFQMHDSLHEEKFARRTGMELRAGEEILQILERANNGCLDIHTVANLCSGDFDASKLGHWSTSCRKGVWLPVAKQILKAVKAEVADLITKTKRRASLSGADWAKALETCKHMLDKMLRLSELQSEFIEARSLVGTHIKAMVSENRISEFLEKTQETEIAEFVRAETTADLISSLHAAAVDGTVVEAFDRLRNAFHKEFIYICKLNITDRESSFQIVPQNYSAAFL